MLLSPVILLSLMEAAWNPFRLTTRRTGQPVCPAGVAVDERGEPNSLVPGQDG
jgi:hypothetical protein